MLSGGNLGGRFGSRGGIGGDYSNANLHLRSMYPFGDQGGVPGAAAPGPPPGAAGGQGADEDDELMRMLLRALGQGGNSAVAPSSGGPRLSEFGGGQSFRVKGEGAPLPEDNSRSGRLTRGHKERMMRRRGQLAPGEEYVERPGPGEGDFGGGTFYPRHFNATTTPANPGFYGRHAKEVRWKKPPHPKLQMLHPMNPEKWDDY
jgi:hypothetical protein